MEKDLAIDKVRDEMAANAKDLNVQYIGEQLTRHIMAHPADAKLFYAEGKNIAGGIKALEEYAKKHMYRQGNTGLACIDPDDGMRIIFEYYGVRVGQAAQPTRPATMAADLDLDALLGT